MAKKEIHFEFVDNNYDDKKIVIEITEDTIDIAIFDIYNPDKINPPNRYASAIISRDDLAKQGLIITKSKDSGEINECQN